LYADIYLQGVKLFEYTYDLCQVSFRNYHHHYQFKKIAVGGCPITPGTKSLKIQNQIPSFAFPGTYLTVASAYVDPSKQKEIGCVSFNFTLA